MLNHNNLLISSMKIHNLFSKLYHYIGIFNLITFIDKLIKCNIEDGIDVC